MDLKKALRERTANSSGFRAILKRPLSKMPRGEY
jgi:hypothetical protein